MERVWDKFITEHDRKVISLASTRPELCWGLGEKPALLLVDLYRAVFGFQPEPIEVAITRFPSSCGLAAWNSLPHIVALLDEFRSMGLPVVHVTKSPAPGIAKWSTGREGDWRGKNKKGEHPDKDYSIIDEVSPLPGEAIIYKSSPSSFFGTPLIAHLNGLRVDSVVICGESTSGCIRAAVVDARTYRLKVVVAEETVFDRHESAHAMNLFDMNEKYADVLPLHKVLDLLHEQVEGRVAIAGGNNKAK